MARDRTLHARRVLIICYHAPPSTAVGGIRWWGLSKYLARLGWDVTLLAHGDPGDTSGPPGVRVVRVARARTLQDRYREWRESRRQTAPVIAPEPPPSPTGPVDSSPAELSVFAAPSGGAGASSFAHMRREIAEMLGFPDLGRGWITRAIIRGRELVREAEPDVIISSGPPHSSHVVAFGLGTGPRTRHFLDYRDPWKGQPTSAAGALVLRSAESFIAGAAEGILATTPELVAQTRDQHPITPVHFVPNGTDTESLPMRVPPPRDRLDVVHIGSLYATRTPVPLLDGLRTLITESPALAAGTTLHFIGEIEAQYLSLIEAAERSGLAANIRRQAPVPRAEALDALSRAHLAIVLAIRQWELVPAKLYESVAMGVPTLVITEPGSASSKAADRVGAVQCGPEDARGIAAAMRQVREGMPPTVSDSATPVRHVDLARDIDRILSLPPRRR